MKLFANLILREDDKDYPLYDLPITHGSRIDDIISDMKEIAEHAAKNGVEIFVDTKLMDDEEHVCLKYSTLVLWSGSWEPGAQPPVMTWTNMIEE